MFDAINPSPALRRKQIVTFVGSMLAHTAIIALVILAPLLYFTEQLPKPPDMLAFVATSAPPPPPPPPPAAPQQPPAARPKIAPAARPNAIAAPVEAPANILPERLPEVPEQTLTSGGVEGGVIGGIAGGVVGGIPMMPSPPPPAPPPPPPRPVRVGGAIEQPALLYRVDPEYPPMAVSAKKEGMVILEATVDANGLVREIRVLRSEPLLDKAAVQAVKQWRYSPLQLNGQAQPFILTVTVSFSL